MPLKYAAILIGLFLAITSVTADDFDDFISDLNAEWAVKNYTNMYQVIDGRLMTYTNDLAALILAMNYYLTIDYDLPQAQSYVSTITNAISSLSWTSDVMAEITCMAIIDEVIDPTDAQNLGVIYGLTSNQLDQIHSESLTNHPLASFVERVKEVQYGQ